ncbi:hypothetical protein WICPIJ_006597, partial [Wickerhamomyces pijperi]
MSVKTYNEEFLVPYTNSTKNHKLIALPNGILTLLISDPAEDLASIGLCIASGANNDPKDVPGLAHFCEHLLLLGSKNYPESNEFHDNLSKAGGRHNAFTTDEQTCYFFEVPSDATYQPLNQKTEEPVFNHLARVFGDAFKYPLFPESMFEREIYAVDNEHNANKNNSGRLLYHGLRLISNPDHPFHQFSTGNFFTLNDLPNMKKIKVKDILSSYYENNYVAERMSLVIRSPQSLNQLQKMAVANFADIKTSSQAQASKKKFKFFGGSKSENTEVVIPQSPAEFDILSNWDYENNSVFSKKELSNCIFIQSSNTQTLRLLFPVESKKYGSSLKLLEDAWCNIVGDESEGSLDDFLKTKGYALGLSAFTQTITVDEDVLVLELKLTNTGSKRLSEIITWTLNKYKTKLLENPSKLARYLCELESVDLLNYLFRDNYKSPMDEASAYAKNLQKNIKMLGAKNIIKGTCNWDSPHNINTGEGENFWNSRANEFKDFVDKIFDFSNLRLTFLGKLDSVSKFINENTTRAEDKATDDYFEFEYIKSHLEESTFAADVGSYEFKPALHNEFIPEYSMDHISLRNTIVESSRESAKSSLSYISKNSWIEEPAENIIKNDKFEVWVKKEKAKVFNSKVFISFEVVSVDQEASPVNTMNTEIFVELLKQKLTKRLYSMELLNYSWEIQASLKGDVRFGFTVSGYSEGIDILLELLVSEFNGFLFAQKISNDELRKARVAVRSRYSELTQNSSIEMALAGLLVVLEEKIWTLEERLDALDDIDLDDFTEFIQGFVKSSKFLKLFVQGDFKDTDSYSVTINTITKHLEDGAVPNFKEPSTHAICPGKSFSIEKPGAKNDPMNAISYFIETGNKDDQRSKQLTRLLSYMMSSTLVPDLRFKKQLGYAVLGGTRILRSKIGIHITIMSGTFTPKYLEKKIKEYLASWEKSLDSMSESKFQAEIIEPYKRNFKKNLTQSGGPENLVSMMLPSIGSS